MEVIPPMRRRITVRSSRRSRESIGRVSAKEDSGLLTVSRYITDVDRANLRAKLKEGALRRARRDLALAEELFLQ